MSENNPNQVGVNVMSKGPKDMGNDSSITLLKAEGKTASESFTQNDFVQLGRHFNNGNGKSFAIAYRKDGKKIYTKSKSKTEETAIKRAYDSTRENAWNPMAFAPYSSNRSGTSRWGALDFDTHDGGWNEERARHLAFRCWQSLLHEAPCVIFENSGRGWHVWLVWKEFRAANWIHHLLLQVALEAGCEIGVDKMEIFPASAPTGLGKPLRLPGTYNPATGRCSVIYSQNVHESEILSSLYVRLESVYRTNLTDTEKNVLCKVTLFRKWAEVWQERFSIKTPRTRNELLAKLVYEVFNQVSREQAELMAGIQFDQKQVTTVAGRREHMREFKAFWEGLEKNFTASLNGHERTFYESLKRQSQKEKFRIVRGWAFLAFENGHDKFPLSIASLAERVGETIPSVSGFRNLLIERCVLRQVEGYLAGVRCGKYNWVLSNQISSQGGIHDGTET